MTSNDKWIVRPAKGQDLNFIYSSWLNNFRSDSAIGRSVRKSVFFGEYYGVLDRLLGESSVLIACLPETPNVIVGYLVFETEPNHCVLHYCFVKEDFRRFGIAQSMVKEAAAGAGSASFTHKTRFIASLVDKYPNLTYNPFLLFSREPKKTEDLNG